MGKLENLHVERTDGVDRPATGRTWVIVKSENSAEVEKDYPALSRAAIEALAKEEGLSLGDETVEALKALASALDIDFAVEKAEEEQPAPAAEATEPEAEVEKNEGDDAPITRADLKGLVKELFGEMVEELHSELDGTAQLDEPVQKARSKQPAGQDEQAERTVTKGQGLFESVIFGQ